MKWQWVIPLLLGGAVLMAVDFFLPGMVLASVGVLLQLIGLIVFGMEATPAQLAWMVMMVIALDWCIVWATIRFFPRTGLGRKMILSHTQERYQPAPESSLNLMVGKELITESPLRPTGSVTVGGRRIEVVAESSFIPKGARVRVVGVREGHLIVTELKTERS
jgi:membrane-bound serine protease (ClpP class)